MNVNQITQKVQKAIKTQQQKQNDFTGDILKMMRLRHNYTQESLSKGLCSVSYMSKMENNQSPTNMYVLREVSKIYNTDIENFTYLNDGSTIIAKLTRALYYEDKELLDEIYQHIKAFGDNPIMYLYQMIAELLDGVYYKIDDNIAEIQTLINCTQTDFTKLFSVSSAIYAYRSNRFHEALNILYSNEALYTEIGEIISLEQIYLYLSSERVGHHSASINHFIKASQSLIEHPHTKYSLILPLYNAYFTAMNKPEMARLMIEKMSLNQFEEKYHNIFIVTYLKSHKHKSDYKYNKNYFSKLSPNYKDESYFQSLIIYENYCKEFQLDYTPPIDNLEFDGDSNLGEMHYKVYLMNEIEEKQSYVKEVALPYAIEQQNLYYISYFTNVLIDFAERSSRYKEALMVNRKREKVIKNIQTINS